LDGLAGRPGDESRLHKERYVCSDTHVRYRHAIMSSRNAAILAVLEPDLDDSQLQLVVSGYVLGYGGLLLFGGRTADLLGRRRTLLTALGVALASLASGVTSNGTLLTGARFLEGAASASSDPVDRVPGSRSGSVVRHNGPDCQLRRR
jgi:MFS family permease